MESSLIYYPVIDTEREKGKLLQQTLQAELFSTLITQDIEKADAILVGGGDGFMLETIKKYQEYQKIFFGVNCGTLGFLLNEINNPKDIPTQKEEMQIINAPLLEVEATQNDGTKHKRYAINDVMIWGECEDHFIFQIKSAEIDQEVKGSWLVISTPLGSSGFWLSNGWPLLSIQSKSLGIMGTACRPFQYRRIPAQSLTISETKKRVPLHIAIDGRGGRIEQIKEFTIAPSDKTVSIWFCGPQLFDDKRDLLESQKLGGGW